MIRGEHLIPNWGGGGVVVLKRLTQGGGTRSEEGEPVGGYKGVRKRGLIPKKGGNFLN